MSRRGLAAGAALVAASATALLAAAPAGAVVTCSYDNTNGLVTVDLGAAGDTVSLSVDAASIQANGAPCAGGPTVINTTNVLVNDFGGGNTDVTIVRPTEFSPGAGGSEDGAAEIEFVLNLSPAPSTTTDRVELTDNSNVARYHVGASGANYNAGAPGDADADIIYTSGTFRRYELNGSSGDDFMTAQGGANTGGPFTNGTVLITGQGGNDTIEGGNGGLASAGDELAGGLGNDTVRGFGAKDTLFQDPGDDTLDCGPGTEDTLDYTSVQGGVTIDLASAAPQPNGPIGADTFAANHGCEVVNGTGEGDRLSGSDAGEILSGRGGNDVLNGRGGADGLLGSAGADTVDYADTPAGVAVDLGAGTATGGAGTDTVSEVENVTGSPFGDTLTGSALANSITGLGGDDTISALAGPDTVDIRDGGPDTASCGTELDGATADQASVDTVNADCEVVSFLPEPDPGGGDGGGGGGGDTELSFELSGKAKQRVLKQKAVVVRASCPLEDCTATARGKKLKPETEPVAAGVTERLEVELKRKPLRAIARALRDGREPKVTVEASVTDAAGNAATDAVTVRAKR